jgi:hypothetical protein
MSGGELAHAWAVARAWSGGGSNQKRARRNPVLSVGGVALPACVIPFDDHTRPGRSPRHGGPAFGLLDAELRALREDNEALRRSSLSFGDLAERLALRVRELEQLLDERP